MIKPQCPLGMEETIKNHKYIFCQYDRSVACTCKDYEECPTYRFDERQRILNTMTAIQLRLEGKL